MDKTWRRAVKQKEEQVQRHRDHHRALERPGFQCAVLGMTAHVTSHTATCPPQAQTGDQEGRGLVLLVAVYGSLRKEGATSHYPG